jgi:cold shock protein
VPPDDDGKDLFVHHSGIAGDGFKSLAEGAKLAYDAQAGDKGPKAASARALPVVVRSGSHPVLAGTLA